MAQYGFHVAVKNCIACKACETACKQEYNLPVGVRRRRVIIQEGETAAGVPIARHISMACNHCTNPACVAACPVTRIYKDANTGLVLLKPNTKDDPASGVDCVGCKRCISACPYGAMVWDPVAKTSDKCTGCIHRLTNMALDPSQRKPACVLTCSAFTLNFGDMAQIDDGSGNGIYGVASKTTSPPTGMADIADPNLTHPNIRFKT